MTSHHTAAAQVARTQILCHPFSRAINLPPVTQLVLKITEQMITSMQMLPLVFLLGPP